MIGRDGDQMPDPAGATCRFSSRRPPIDWDPLILVTLDRAGDPNHDRLIDEMPTDVEIQVGILQPAALNP